MDHDVFTYEASTPIEIGMQFMYETVLYEADISNIPLVNHMSHLIIHGVLHLLEFDHESKKEETKMRKIEKNILKSVGIPDPYIVN